MSDLVVPSPQTDQRLTSALPCFACGAYLVNICPGVDNQPDEGTEFRSRGHYGSTFWDSFDAKDLVLNICDRCLRSHKDRLAVQRTQIGPLRPYDTEEEQP